ncbi:MAG: hypothetical protein ACRD0Q_07405 [Acidimicrobiales bacterium]
MLAITSSWQDDLATELTSTLGIPFQSDGATIGFPKPLRLTDWSVPLIFDGHAGHRDDDLIPIDFVGHVLWAYLDATTTPEDSRSWWTCRLTPSAAQAILEAVTPDLA